ncbi:MAG TPA: response regulator [Thermodesulfobacteriota bacterium]|nr:response regulator [Deltaproteobacteria bacterium]HNR12035.1 response regulator [Thermodesulfobacteriota bacterium]HNU72752.1 response regulator [Thermodesulfobacteriota bacterium]HOC37944.1 response regulator [Thermodesulfobacteriota bacterium]HQO79092.1 response regulator [Thermodesulfobacteriota bacterium]
MERVSRAIPGKRTILLVDDEEMVIDVGEKMLRVMGYEVILARSGKEAIDIVSRACGFVKGDTVTDCMRKPPLIPDLVILDIVMPEMGGSETYDRLMEINPELKVILASGYSLEDQAWEILERGCNGFIQKPFNLQQLCHTIQQVMEQ